MIFSPKKSKQRNSKNLYSSARITKIKFLKKLLIIISHFNHFSYSGQFKKYKQSQLIKPTKSLI